VSEKRYVVELSAEERAELAAVVKSGKPVSAEKRTRAQVLLKVDEGPDGPGWSDEAAAGAFDVNPATVRRLRKRLVEEGFGRALHRRKQRNPSVRPKLDGAAEARLIAAAQGPPPEGRARWSLRLLADKAVELGVAEGPVSHETVRRTLKKTNSSRTARRTG